MKKLLRLLLFLGVFFVCTPVFAQSEDRILEYKSVIDVKKSTDIHVIETITFQPNIFLERHGIEWSIPYVYSTSAFRRPTQLSINSVIYFKKELKYINTQSNFCMAYIFSCIIIVINCRFFASKDNDKCAKVYCCFDCFY